MAKPVVSNKKKLGASGLVFRLYCYIYDEFLKLLFWISTQHKSALMPVCNRNFKSSTERRFTNTVGYLMQRRKDHCNVGMVRANGSYFFLDGVIWCLNIIHKHDHTSLGRGYGLASTSAPSIGARRKSLDVAVVLVVPTTNATNEQYKAILQQIFSHFCPFV